MTTTTRQAITIAILMIGGIAILVGDLHRLAIKAVWPYFLYLFAS